MTILVAATESEEGALALETAISEARLRETGLIVANLRLSPLDPSAVPSDIDTKVWSGGQGWTWRTTWWNSSTNRRTSRCW
jgi:hypothetical protein